MWKSLGEAWVRNSRKAIVVISVCQCTRRLGPVCWGMAVPAQALLLGTLNTGLRRGAGRRRELGTYSGCHKYRQRGMRKPAGGWEAKGGCKRTKPAVCLVVATLHRLSATTNTLGAELLRPREPSQRGAVDNTKDPFVVLAEPENTCFVAFNKISNIWFSQ